MLSFSLNVCLHASMLTGLPVAVRSIETLWTVLGLFQLVISRFVPVPSEDVASVLSMAFMSHMPSIAYSDVDVRYTGCA